MKINVVDYVVYEPVVSFEPTLAYHCRTGWTLFYLGEDGVQTFITGTEHQRLAVTRAAMWLSAMRRLEGCWLEAWI